MAKFLLLVLVICAALSSAFMTSSRATRAGSLYMAKGEKGAASKSLNMPRKLKRTIRSLKPETFNSFFTAENDNYLKNDCKGGVYENIMKQLTKRARELKVTVKTGFGEKPVVVLPDLVDTAVSAGSFSTLVKAVTACGLGPALKGTDMLTVLAPTDEAFAKLPEGTLDSLLADIPKLTAILKYHVIPGFQNSKKVVALDKKGVATLNGQEVKVKVGRQDNVVTLEGAGGGESTVTKVDIRAKNGMIHVIDTVLMPKADA